MRALRRTRGLTLAELAGRLGRSVGWLSQVERDLSPLGPGDAAPIAAALDVPVSLLADRAGAGGTERGRIVRRDARRPIGSRHPGLNEELLSPDLTDDFEVVHSVFAPGAALEQPMTRPTQELGFMIGGKLDLWIGGQSYTVAAGDSFRIRGETYRWANPYEETAVALWVIAPPVY